MTGPSPIHALFAPPGMNNRADHEGHDNKRTEPKSKSLTASAARNRPADEVQKCCLWPSRHLMGRQICASGWLINVRVYNPSSRLH